MKIIGLGHYSRVGKDTFANYLVESLAEYQPSLKVLKRSFAWKLKQVTHELFSWAGLREPEFYETAEGAAVRQVKLLDLDMTPVEIWVAFGTKAVREQVYSNTWVDYLLRQTDCDVLIIPDVRFPNEAEAIHKLGGQLIKVVRPGFGPLNTVADQALHDYSGWDAIVGQDGEISSLHHAANHLAKEIVCSAQ